MCIFMSLTTFTPAKFEKNRNFVFVMDYKELKSKINNTPSSGKVRNPRRYRLDFIKENTFNRLWSIRMTRTRVWIGTIAFLAAVAALIFVVFAFTPMRRLIPMKMEKATRAGYLEASLRLDSLERAVERQTLYTAKVSDILEGRSTADSIANITPSGAIAVDSASIQAREAEKRFVKTYENDRNFNLSVLAPIAAEGMDFPPLQAGWPHTRERRKVTSWNCPPDARRPQPQSIKARSYPQFRVPTGLQVLWSNTLTTS